VKYALSSQSLILLDGPDGRKFARHFLIAAADLKSRINWVVLSVEGMFPCTPLILIFEHMPAILWRHTYLPRRLLWRVRPSCGLWIALQSRYAYYVWCMRVLEVGLRLSKVVAMAVITKANRYDNHIYN
jgi:hypothetical protein